MQSHTVSVWKPLIIFLVLESAYGIPLAEFYPYGEAVGDAALPPNDDGASLQLNLSLPFPFYDTEYSTIYVGNNGGISFVNALFQFTPEPFPLDFELIAPFWADVDTRGIRTGVNNTVWYRETSDPDTLSRSRNDIQSFFDDDSFNPIYLFIATWDHVGYYNAKTDKTNTFQCVLATDGLTSFVIFLYADDEIQWTTGDASGGTDGLGGTPAQIGFNAGDGIRSTTVPGSGTVDIINITRFSNGGENGVLIYQVDENEVQSAGCNGGWTVFPRVGNMLGGTSVIVTGPCTNERGIKGSCKFGDLEVVAGVTIDDQNSRFLCVAPKFSMTGRIDLLLSMNDSSGGEYQGEAVFYSLSIERAHAVDFGDNSLLLEEEMVKLTWPKEMIIPIEDTQFKVDIKVFEFGEKIDALDPMMTFTMNNEGEAEISLSQSMSGIGSNDIYPVIFQVALAQSEANQQQAGLVQMLAGSSPGLWTGVAYYSPKAFRSQSFESLCQNWYNRSDNINLYSLEPCPPTLARARTANSGFEEELFTSLIASTSYDSLWREFFHPGISTCFIESRVRSGPRSECCYDDNGELKPGPTGGGSADSITPEENIIGHYKEDVLPYIYCCKDDTPTDAGCRGYYMKRPSREGMYNPPPPACVYGDPHLVTLDGLKYTFNGKGEFTLLETTDDAFTLQGRMVEANDVGGDQVAATVFSALVGKQNDSDTVQFELSRRGGDALVNGERVILEDLPEQDFNNVTISDRGNSTLSAMFSSGAYLEVKEEHDIISVLIVSLPNTFRGTTRGLLGSFNGDSSDDLVPKTGGDPISVDSSLQEVHEQFGVSWIIDDPNDSLFTYTPGENWATFYSPDFIPIYTTVFSDPELEAEAIALCEGDPFCLFDVAATRRTDIGLSTLLGSQAFDLIVNLSTPVVCDPPCENGACVANDTCNCADGFEGDQCTEAVFTECDINPCENGGSCTLHAGSYICDCSAGFDGSFCQIPIGCLSSCSCSRNIECSIDAEFTGESSVTQTGVRLKCIISFDENILRPETVAIDSTFDSRYLSAGSLSFLSQLNIISRGSQDFVSCMVNTTQSPQSPLLESLGIQTLEITHLEDDGSFGILRLEKSQLQQIITEGDYTVNGVLSTENACSFQYLTCWLNTSLSINNALCRRGPSAAVAAFSILCY